MSTNDYSQNDMEQNGQIPEGFTKESWESTKTSQEIIDAGRQMERQNKEIQDYIINLVKD